MKKFLGLIKSLLITYKNYIFTDFVSFVKYYLVRWAFKVGGSIFGYVGLDQGKVEDIIGGIILFILGTIYTAWAEKDKEEKKQENAQSK